MRRQVDQNPEAFKKSIITEPSRVISSGQEERKGELSRQLDDKSSLSHHEQPPSRQSKRQKRPATDKQTAFQEFKSLETGLQMENQIKETRNAMQAERADIRNATDQLNAIKQEIDALKARLDRKEDERKAKYHELELRNEDAFEEQHHEEIIDEEELVLLKQMKDYKKQYRDGFAQLKEMKIDLANNQRKIDVVKEQLISAFEEWYGAEFEVPDSFMQTGFDQSLQNELKAQALETESNTLDEDQATFMRAKRKVDTLAKAKRLEKQIGAKK